ncbi:hypothetical protein [Halomonas sp. 3H]|uniref:hypothetical protein n=1 Tax=Halomonas sp. 3H TaxID=2952527 RepID=UPI0020B86C4D|nr:hypothetical protein [Halomonas sp. 3H]
MEKMLTDEDKYHIRLEELFRQEVRSELASQSDESKSWHENLFESTRSRFLATAFVIPFFIWMHAYFEAEIQERKSEAAFVERIELEVRERIAGNAILLKQESPMFFTNINAFYLYPEFKGWGVSVLLIELSNKGSSLPNKPLEKMEQAVRRGNASQVMHSAEALGWIER